MLRASTPPSGVTEGRGDLVFLCRTCAAALTNPIETKRGPGRPRKVQ